MAKQRRYSSSTVKRNARPAVFGFSKDELIKMKMKPRISLTLLRESKGNSKDWESVLSRLATGREIAINTFNDDVGEELHDAFVLWATAYINAIRDAKWVFTPEQYLQISNALDIVDDAMDRITRREYLLIFTNAIDVQIKDMSELTVSWEDYKKRRAHELRKAGRKVIINI